MKVLEVLFFRPLLSKYASFKFHSFSSKNVIWLNCIHVLQALVLNEDIL